jgi:hypothetical protein
VNFGDALGDSCSGEGQRLGLGLGGWQLRVNNPNSMVFFISNVVSCRESTGASDSALKEKKASLEIVPT